MPINNNSAFYDSIDQVYWPKDFAKWEDLGAGFNNATTITSVNGASVSNGALTFGQSHTSYWQLTYNDSIRLHDRTDWTIEFRIRINTDSTSTTNFQTGNDGIIICQGDGDIDAVSNSDRPNWVVYLDQNNLINFGYYTGTSYITTTSSGWSLGNDDYYDISLKKSGLQLNVYINNVNQGLITLNSDDIATSTEDLFIGGNPGGDYLYNADISAIRIRKDNYSGDTLTANGDLHLVDDTLTSTPTYDGKWDTDVLLYLPVTETSGTTTEQAYLKTFPATWGDWTHWFVNPTHQIDVTTSTITFDETTTGFKDISVVTTDGFTCAFGAGAQQLLSNFSESNALKSRQWRANNSGIHGQGGDIWFARGMQSYLGASYYSSSPCAQIEQFDSTSFNLKLPTRGYFPESEPKGKRPRGLKKITYKVNTKTVNESYENKSDETMFTLGMPYFDVTDNVFDTTTEGGFYKSGGGNTNFRDWDFRFNADTLAITNFSLDSADAVVITTSDAHGLTTGDQVHMRLGMPWQETLAMHSLDALDFFHKVNGIKYVQVIDSTKFKMFYDASRSVAVEHTPLGTYPNGFFFNTGGHKFFSSSAQKNSDTWKTYIPNFKFRLAEWSKLFQGISSVNVGSSNLGVDPQYIKNATLSWAESKPTLNDTYTSDASTSIDNLNLTGKRSPHVGNFAPAGVTIDYKAIPKGTQSDPFVIKSRSGGYTTGSSGFMAAPLYIALDARYAGTLKIQVSDVETADSTTPTNIKYSCVINGEGDAAGPKPFSTETFGNTISIAIGKGTRSPAPLYSNYFVNMSLVVYLDGVVHTSNADRSKATYSIWYEGGEGQNEHRALLYAGGLQPNREVLEQRSQAPSMSFGVINDAVHRPHNWILYQGWKLDEETLNPNINIDIKGIPPIAYSLTGETYLSNKLEGANINGGGPGTRQFYYGPYVSETLHNEYNPSSGIDWQFMAAPWLEQATMTIGMKRIYAGFVYECQQDHISSKNFDDDYNLGYWTIILT